MHSPNDTLLLKKTQSRTQKKKKTKIVDKILLWTNILQITCERHNRKAYTVGPSTCVFVHV